jgi:hypothetical protein
MRAAVLLWVCVGIAATVHVAVSPVRHNLWPVFRDGGLGWWRGQNIYEGPHYFSYSPAFAALLAPLAALPGVLGNAVFDLGSLALLFFSIRRLTRVVFPAEVLSRHEPAVLALSLIGVLRCVWSSQAHAMSAAMIFFAAATLVEERWWAAAFALALAVHMKLAPVILAGVVALLWPRTMSWRIAAALGAWGLLPFACGQPERALAMYGEWAARLRWLAARRFPSFRDVWHLFELVQAAVPMAVYRAIQGLCGLAVLFWTWRLRRRGVAGRWLVSGVFAITICYMLLFGPAVEFTQYPLLAPWVSAALLAQWPHPRTRWALLTIFVATMIAGFGAVEDYLARLLHSPAPEALITLGTAGFAAWVVRSWRRAPDASRA